MCICELDVCIVSITPKNRSVALDGNVATLTTPFWSPDNPNPQYPQVRKVIVCSPSLYSLSTFNSQACSILMFYLKKRKKNVHTNPIFY